jgi:hypothetical protein
LSIYISATGIKIKMILEKMKSRSQAFGSASALVLRSTNSTRMIAGSSRSVVLTLRRHYGFRNAGFVALGMVSSSAPALLTLCDSDGRGEGIWDAIFPKDHNGNIYWDKASRQVTDSIFWDKLAKVTGQKVRSNNRILVELKCRWELMLLVHDVSFLVGTNCH